MLLPELILEVIHQYPRGIRISELQRQHFPLFATKTLLLALQYLESERLIEQTGVFGGYGLWGPIGLSQQRAEEAATLERRVLEIVLANSTKGIARRDVCKMLGISQEDRQAIRPALEALEACGKIARFPMYGVKCRWGGPGFAAGKSQPATQKKKRAAAPSVKVKKVSSVWELGK